MKAPTVIAPRVAHKRRRLLEAARALSYAQGLSGLSLDETAAHTGISKRTLYRYFGSRDAFIAALVDFDGEAWREWFFDAIRERADAPGPRLYAFFDTLASWTTSPDYQGCLFAQALCGGASHEAVVLQAAQGQLEYVRKFLYEHAHKAGVRQPAAFAALLLLPTIGVLSGAGGRVSPHPDRPVTALAGALLQCHGVQRSER